MQDDKPSSDGKTPDDNPYAPPRNERMSAVEETVTDHRKQREEHLRRESCIRVTGLLCLILAIFVILSFGLGALYELRTSDISAEAAIDSWLYRRWLARMTGVISIAVVAAVVSFGLYWLRSWGRWWLTIVALLHASLLLIAWLLLGIVSRPEIQEYVDPTGLFVMSVVSALSSLPLLLLVWSRKGRTVFAPGYLETIRRTSDLRPGCSGSVLALCVVPTVLVWHVTLLMTVLLIVLMLGFISSI
jgi:hypothetical protein